MATKKTMGKRQRDRLKKAQAKKEQAAAAAANPTYSQAASFNDRPSSGPPTRVQELDPGTYNNVEFLTNTMGMGDCVAESVTVDRKGRRLRVMMGTEPNMDLLSQRLHDEKEFQTRLDRLSELFNGLLSDIPIQSIRPDLEAQYMSALGEVNMNLHTMLSQSHGNIENDYCNSQGAMLFRGHPSYIKLVLARHYDRYNFARLQGDGVLAQQIDGIERGLMDIHYTMASACQDLPMDDIL
ncbi:hypothetical protein CMUS01_15106 [Colletotrichum musicola]|uniref:Uncharacterized protein n=1 Tax=Colletotrichum musicola TaxID=2175873 RepID=A0A8H6IZH8_9PEZI|nr:hypothetical protein CMUS01_15106 [Colletotrichum musicola]